MSLKRVKGSEGIGELQPTTKNYGRRSSRYAMVLDKDMKVEVVFKVRLLRVLTGFELCSICFTCSVASSTSARRCQGSL